MKGIVFDIQHYSIYDGPGIRTSVYLKGCNLKCSWCHNPESQVRSPQMAYWTERCDGCGLCVPVCRNNALALYKKTITRDQSRCRACNACAIACPKNAMELLGKEMSINHILEEVLKDQVFYDHSKGGVTITGGEPTVQSDFLKSLLQAFKEKNIHIALETCGYFSAGLTEFLMTHVDLFLFDLKHLDPTKHKEATGVDNQIILENFRKILSQVGDQRIVVRIPLIPGFNADSVSLSAIRGFLDESGFNGEVHLLPYHNLGVSKYERIGREAILHSTIVKEDLEAFKRFGVLYGR